MDDAKIYNVCLQRVMFQISNAKKRHNGTLPSEGRQILESYNTGDMDEIIDILELYDMDEQSPAVLAQKLEELAYTVSLLVRDNITFDYDSRGNLGIYLVFREKAQYASESVAEALAAA